MVTMAFHDPSGKSIRPCREENDGQKRGEAKEDSAVIPGKQVFDQDAARE